MTEQQQVQEDGGENLTAEQQEISDLGDRMVKLVMVAFEERLLPLSMVFVVGDRGVGLDIQSCTPYTDSWDQAVESVLMLGRALRRIAASAPPHRQREMLEIVQQALGGPEVARIIESDA